MALQESIGTSSPWKYAKAILDSWLEKKAFTAEQAKAALIEFKRRRSKPTANKKSFEQREYTKEDLEKRKADSFAELERMYGNGSG